MINNLSIAEKIELYNCLYEDLAGKGIEGDTQLAHVNVEEMAVLRAMGGSGTINPHTNLIQFGGGGAPSPPPAPAQQTVTQQATIPDELKPFVTDVLEKAQAIQERREEEGYVPFSGPRIAEFSPEQTQAFEQIKGLVGTGQQYFDPAARLTASSAFAPTGPQVGQFMNPYIQNVVDIQQREARRAGDIERQRLGAQAVGAGSFGGSRQAILEAEQSRNLQQQLGDIQARGLAAAYEDAQTRLQQQRERERLAGAQFASLGQAAPGQAFRELSALEAIGAQRQQQAQQALDIAQQEYEIARTFPERTLQDYQSIIRGYAAPIPASTVQRSQTTRPAPSFLQQAAGLGGLAIGAGQAFGAFKKEGGLVGLANGGSPATAASQGVPDDRPSPFPEFLSNLGKRLFGSEEMSEEEKLRERSARKLLREKAIEKDIAKEALKDSPQTLEKILPKIEEQSTFGIKQSALSQPEKRQATIEQAKKIEEENVLAAKKAEEEKLKLAEEKKKAQAVEAAKIPVKPPVSEPAFGDIRSLMASEKKIADALTKKYEGQAKALAEQKEDLGYGMADFAQGLLKFAAADPEKATSQQLAEAFGDLPEKNKEAITQRRAIELAETGLEADKAVALADRERGVVELNIKIRKALADKGLDAKDMDTVFKILDLTDPKRVQAALIAAKPNVRLAAESILNTSGTGTGPKSRTELAGRDVSMTAASEGTKK